MIVCLLPLGAVAVSGRSGEDLYDYFRNFAGLSDAQISDVSNGKVFVKELPSPDPAKIFLFGAVLVNSSPESYMKLVRDVDSLRELPYCLAVQQFSTPPRLSDLIGFTVDSEDIEDLKVCVPGNCKVQLPAEEIEEFKKAIDWSAKDVADQVNHLAQKLAMEALIAYQRGGDKALGAYRHKKNPILISEEFRELVGQIKSLPVYLPEFGDYLLGYPKSELPNMENRFYWEKIRFGLKPTIRLVHAILYRNPSDRIPVVYALKQLYSSHYFHTAIDLTTCVKAADQPGFFLITIVASEQAGLTGIKGFAVRNIAVSRARTLLESVLAGIKKALANQT